MFAARFLPRGFPRRCYLPRSAGGIFFFRRVSAHRLTGCVWCVIPVLLTGEAVSRGRGFLSLSPG